VKVADIDTSIELPVMESFYTIQGEGYHSGRSAYFIRLAGCDVGCIWCDVKESWEADKHPLVSINDLITNSVGSGTDFIVITGGEPAMYNLTTFVKKLKQEGLTIAIETSGAYPLKGDVDWYCFSPKKFNSPLDEAYTRASELKVIVNHASDLDWAEMHSEKVSKDCILYLQPEWSKRERFLPLIIDHVKKNPKWRISLQTHKYMNIP
jgi:7-carboxy-7-deazaguanine synthase